MTTYHLYAPTHPSHKQILTNTLLRSPDIASGVLPYEILWNPDSASKAYNRVLDRATADIVIFSHCDVYFPRGWIDRLDAALTDLTERDPNWAVAGLVGLTERDELVGRIWDNALQRVLGAPMDKPVRVIVFDELVIIFRRSSGLRFDPDLPDFHLYAADIVLTAEKSGKTGYVLDVPAVHNCKPMETLEGGYTAAYKYVQKKWRDRLPVPTLVATLTADPWMLMKRRVQMRYKSIFRSSTFNRIRMDDPSRKAIELGFEFPARRSPAERDRSDAGPISIIRKRSGPLEAISRVSGTASTWPSASH